MEAGDAHENSAEVELAARHRRKFRLQMGCVGACTLITAALFAYFFLVNKDAGKRSGFLLVFSWFCIAPTVYNMSFPFRAARHVLRTNNADFVCSRAMATVGFWDALLWNVYLTVLFSRAS